MDSDKYEKIVSNRLISCLNEINHKTDVMVIFKQSPPLVKRIYNKIRDVYRKIRTIRVFKTKYSFGDILDPVLRPFVRFAKKCYQKLRESNNRSAI